MASSQTVAIIGAGRVGSSVGYLLKHAGYRIAGVAARTGKSAQEASTFIGSGEATIDVAHAAATADIVFITTPDRVIKEVCDRIASRRAFRQGALVIHMSGAHSLDLLEGAGRSGAKRAVLHPLQSLASREQGVKTLPGSYFRIEADLEARETARSLVEALGGIELVMPKWSPDKESAALYHAGAVAVSNYFVALVHYGLKFYQELGADKQEALQAILPLIRGTLHNIEALGIPDAVSDHLAAMQKRAPGLVGLYKELGRETVEVARDKGSIDQAKGEELLKLLL
jgi:predicted short-subunit dehydrogenase-like oxidoreductase (DUF2520 family)